MTLVGDAAGDGVLLPTEVQALTERTTAATTASGLIRDGTATA
jgi:hypothetical protein